MFKSKKNRSKISFLQKRQVLFVYILVLALFAQSISAQFTDSKTQITENSKSAVKNITIQQSDNLAPTTASFTEGFEGGTFPPTGWAVQNLSSPIGTNPQCWNQFTGTTPWSPQTGNGQSGANFNCTSGANTISGWLFGPEITFNNGDQIKFWTRKAPTDTFPDRLELRLSTNGSSTNAGATSTSVGDFTTVLLTVNPTLVTGVYPTNWAQFTATISGLGGPTNGRFAFRYFVTNGGPSGANSDIIAIDNVDYINNVTTAAGVTVSGAVRTSTGRGIPQAIVQFTDLNGEIRQTRTNSFGYYQFKDVEVGNSYIFNVFSKQYQFSPQIISVSDNIQNLDFIAQ